MTHADVIHRDRKGLAAAIRAAIQRSAHVLGLDVRRYSVRSSVSLRRKRLLAFTGIDVMLDIGANEGQYAHDIRTGGYRGPLLSFEPQGAVYEQLRLRCADDPEWLAFPSALGAAPGRQRLHISRFSPSSSLLPMQPRHDEITPGSGYQRDEVVEIRTVDEIVSELGFESARLGLKLDVQGYEAEVLAGASNSLPHTDFVECEVLLEPLYQGQAQVVDLFSTLYGAGLHLASTDPGWVDDAIGRMSWLEAIFLRPR